MRNPGTAMLLDGPVDAAVQFGGGRRMYPRRTEPYPILRVYEACLDVVACPPRVRKHALMW